ncbi:hypothetical protein FF021_08210 [Leptospira noguchii]|nr:hypothetical protein FF021_08210 [Leptospira noguchii]
MSSKSETLNLKERPAESRRVNRCLSRYFTGIQFYRIELLKNSLVQINKTSSMNRFHEKEQIMN